MMHETDYDGAGADAPEAGRHITSSSPQPCWMALDAARDQAFTGEIVFDAEPEVRVYLDNGVAYYAERADDDTLGRRLIAAGLIDAVQLERGMVRVGDVEHLGRLFDRDPTVDRDAVMVVTEDATDSRLADLANNVIASSRATAYRHHESGVHRWFVAPVSGGYMTRPVSDVAPLDNSVVEDLPGLPSAESGSIGDELRIEWDQPIADLTPTLVAEREDSFEPDLLGTALDTDDIVDSPFGDRLGAAAPESFAPPVVDPAPDVELDVAAPVVEVDDEPVAAAVSDLTAPDPVAGTEVILPLDEDFHIVWPDGTEEAPIVPAAESSAQPVDDTADAIAGEVLLPGRPAEPDVAETVETIDEPDVAAAEPEPVADDVEVETDVLPTPEVEVEPMADLADEPVVEPVVDASVEAEWVVDLSIDQEMAAHGADAPVAEPFVAPASEDDVSDAPPAPDPERAAERSADPASAPDSSEPDVDGDESTDEPPRIDFEVPALVLSDFPSAEGAVPDDVSSAVLRAIRAIENASTAAPHVAPILGADSAAALAPAPVEPAPAPMGFAPPTLETSAEVMYAAAAAAAEQEADAPSPDQPETETFEPRVASVVFVDDEEEPEPEDRAGALRRLIGSLRRR